MGTHEEHFREEKRTLSRTRNSYGRSIKRVSAAAGWWTSCHNVPNTEVPTRTPRTRFGPSAAGEAPPEFSLVPVLGVVTSLDLNKHGAKLGL